MRAEVRRLHSPDVLDLRGYTPPVSDDFSVLIQILAGPLGLDGEESFDIDVLTPKRLASRVAQKGPVSGCHLLIVECLADQLRPGARRPQIHPQNPN